MEGSGDELKDLQSEEREKLCGQDEEYRRDWSDEDVPRESNKQVEEEEDQEEEREEEKEKEQVEDEEEVEEEEGDKDMLHTTLHWKTT